MRRRQLLKSRLQICHFDKHNCKQRRVRLWRVKMFTPTKHDAFLRRLVPRSFRAPAADCASETHFGWQSFGAMRQSVQGTLGDPPPKEMGSEAILRLDHPLIRPVLEARSCEACTPLRSCTRRPRANRFKRLQAGYLLSSAPDHGLSECSAQGVSLCLPVVRLSATNATCDGQTFGQHQRNPQIDTK